MKEYHKIQTVFKRDPETKNKRLLIDQYSTPEFAYLANNEWVFTEKVDRTNIRIMFTPGPRETEKFTLRNIIEFGGKTDNAQIPAPLVTRLQQLFLHQTETFIETFPDGACLYGEGYGAKIQKGGGNYSATPEFVLFDVKVGDWWLQRKDVEELAAKFGLQVVPIIGRGTLTDMVEKCRCGFPSEWRTPNGGEIFTAEGIVARPATEIKDRAGRRIITKIKCVDFVG